MSTVRNEAILARYDETLSLTQVGKEFNLTRERIRQIVKEERGKTYGNSKRSYPVQVRRLFWTVFIAARYEHRRRHGTALRYSLGCKCAECRKANLDRHNELMEKLAKAEGRTINKRSPEARANMARANWPQYYP